MWLCKLEVGFDGKPFFLAFGGDEVDPGLEGVNACLAVDLID
jgi:hypothetical protein